MGVGERLINKAKTKRLNGIYESADRLVRSKEREIGACRTKEEVLHAILQAHRAIVANYEQYMMYIERYRESDYMTLAGMVASHLHLLEREHRDTLEHLHALEIELNEAYKQRRIAMARLAGARRKANPSWSPPEEM